MNWLYLLIVAPAFAAIILVGWSDASIIVKAIALPLALAAIVAARFILARQLSFQFLLLARSLIWFGIGIALAGIATRLFDRALDPPVIAAMLFGLFFGIFGVSLMVFLAIGKPCPMCDGRSPIQFIKGPLPSVGTEFQLSFFQSGVASQCPLCEADWSFTEDELREARQRKNGA
jgi:hypothetical protein